MEQSTFKPYSELVIIPVADAYTLLKVDWRHRVRKREYGSEGIKVWKERVNRHGNYASRVFVAKNGLLQVLRFLHNLLCGSYAQSQRHLNMNTHSSFVFYFPSASASNDAFPVVSFSEPEGALATILPAYKYIHTVYALNTCTHKCKHCAI